jgi:hypothetical protein
MKKIIIIIIIIVGIFVAIRYASAPTDESNLIMDENKTSIKDKSDSIDDNQSDTTMTDDYKNTEYLINGEKVKLVDGRSETEALPGSASKIYTEYFGNELFVDMNDDGREDVAFIVTQQTGGSGTFFYAVAALNTENGWVGSDGYFLGDRIAPQSTDLSQNPSQVNVVVFNYMDQKPTDAMNETPSVGKSVYLKLVTENMMWAIVEPDFEGESR